MVINASVLIGISGLICTILFSYLSYLKGLKKESTDTGRTTGTLMSDIGYIKAGVDDLKRKQETYEDRHFALVERVKGVEESTKSAHKRIDGLEAKEHVL